VKKEERKEKSVPIIEKALLLEIEKTFRRIWDKERKTEELFKKAVSLRENAQTLLVQELCKPEDEQNKEIISVLGERMRDAEEAIDTVASLTMELRELKEYFYGWMTAPEKASEE
jgi:hypothetical protein